MTESARKSDIIDLTLNVHARTEKALLLSDAGDEEKAVWIPLSQIEINRDEGGWVNVDMPEWLAYDKGLI